MKEIWEENDEFGTVRLAQIKTVSFESSKLTVVFKNHIFLFISRIKSRFNCNIGFSFFIGFFSLGTQLTLWLIALNTLVSSFLVTRPQPLQTTFSRDCKYLTFLFCKQYFEEDTQFHFYVLLPSPHSWYYAVQNRPSPMCHHVLKKKGNE